MMVFNTVPFMPCVLLRPSPFPACLLLVCPLQWIEEDFLAVGHIPVILLLGLLLNLFFLFNMSMTTFRRIFAAR